MTRICVVGAGPSGLTTIKTLLAAGLEVDCYELSPHIGGHWVIDNPSGRSSAYRSLRTNTTKRMSRFSDYEMPEDWDEFPSVDKVREWLEAYVDRFDLRKHIQTSTEIISAVPRPGGGWQVTLRAGDEAPVVRTYDAVIAASGSYWDPQQPAFTGRFNGDILHAQTYRDPHTPVDTSGANTIVCGIGNTGCEIACEISKSNAATVYLSARSGTWIMPKLVNGVAATKNLPMAHPTDPVPPELSRLPEAEREQKLTEQASETIRQTYGAQMKEFEMLGLPRAPHHPLLKRPSISQDLMDQMVSGRIHAKPDIDRLDGDHVIFTGGESVRADIIICATGYKLSYPYLSQDIANTQDNDLSLFCGIVSPAYHDLFFIGVSRPTGAFWPIAEAQAKFVAAILTKTYTLPPAAEIRQRTGPMLNRVAMNPVLYGLALREELERGRTRKRATS